MKRSGTIESVGPEVSGFKPGDAVSTIPAFSQQKYGMYGDLVLAPATAVAKHPANLSWAEAASIWMQYITAYGALIDVGHLAAGETILIPAASSSVGIAAIQIANLVGATPIALTRTNDKRAELTKLGAAHVIATQQQDLVTETMRLTDGKGARMVFDPVAGPTVAKLTAAMASGGILFEYGNLSSEPTPLPLMDVLGKLLTIRGYVMFEVSQNPTRLAMRRGIRRVRIGFGQAQADHRQDVPLRRDRRGHAVLGIESADRQSRRYVVNRGLELGQKGSVQAMAVEHYQNVVIGSGEAGKFLGWTLAREGQRTVIVEKSTVGGACPNVACLPSKNVIHSAKVFELTKRAASFGIATGETKIDMAGVLRRKRKMIAGLAELHATLFQQSGAELLMGEARFTEPKTFQLTTPSGEVHTLRGERVFLALGTRASLPGVPGLADARPMTHVEVLNLDRLPDHLVVLGGGYVGLEFAQAMRRFGRGSR